MKIALVTGATSFIGMNIMEVLLKKGYFVYAVVRPASKNLSRIPKNEQVQMISLDMSCIIEIVKLVKHVDVFFSLAWEGTRGTLRQDANLQQKNKAATIAALTIAIELKASVFVGCGSQAEYGRHLAVTTEDTLAHPDSEYGKAKLECYRVGIEIANKSPIRFIWPRIFSIYGYGDFKDTLIMDALEKMLRNETIQCTECTQDWDYLNVKDGAEALVLLSETKGAEGVYNVAEGKSRPLRCFLEEMKEVVHSESIIEYGAKEMQANGHFGFRPSVEKLKKIGWNPQINFADGIKNMHSTLLIIHYSKFCTKHV